MSYIQIEIGGKLRGLKFNRMAQLILEEKVKVGNLMSGIYGLIYGGLVANDYVKGIEPDYTFEDACDWADSIADEDLLKIQAAFQESEGYKKTKAFLEEVEAAKKNET